MSSWCSFRLASNRLSPWVLETLALPSWRRALRSCSAAHLRHRKPPEEVDLTDDGNLSDGSGFIAVRGDCVVSG